MEQKITFETLVSMAAAAAMNNGNRRFQGLTQEGAYFEICGKVRQYSYEEYGGDAKIYLRKGDEGAVIYDPDLEKSSRTAFDWAKGMDAVLHITFAQNFSD